MKVVVTQATTKSDDAAKKYLDGRFIFLPEGRCQTSIRESEFFSAELADNMNCTSISTNNRKYVENKRRVVLTKS